MSDVDLVNLKAFERAFPDMMNEFYTDLNFTESGEEVYQLLVALGRKLGFRAVTYEFCQDVEDENARLFQRSNFSSAFTKLDELLRPHMKIGYGRRHVRDKWTAGVSGHAFSDMFTDHPDYQKKLKVASIIPGFTSGFGFALRSPNPKARAGLVFAGSLPREQVLELAAEHGGTIQAIAWASHIRILQHAAEGRGLGVDLTERQMDYLHWLEQGLLDKQIAHEMGISHSGVRKHQHAVCKKFNVTRRGDIIAAAIRRGVLMEPEIAPDVKPAGLWDIEVHQGQAPPLPAKHESYDLDKMPEGCPEPTEI